MKRSADELRALSREMRGVSLYCHQFCPVSIKTCRAVHQLNIPVECRDVRKSQVYRDDLLAGVGQLRTPSLRVVEGGQVQWICGSENILSYLLGRVGPAQEEASRAA